MHLIYISIKAIAKLALFFTLGAGFVWAQSGSQPMVFSVQQVCVGGDCERLIVASGLIERDSSIKLEKILRSLPGPTTIEMNSVGGDLPGALQLGETIRVNGLNTRVRFEIPKDAVESANLKPAQCYSACLMAFMGGVNRTVSPQALIGFQNLQTSALASDSGFGLQSLIDFLKDNKTPPSSVPAAPGNSVQTAANLLTRYAERMGIDRRVIDLIITGAPGQINYIDITRARQLSIDTRSKENLSQWRVNATKSGALVGTITETQKNGQLSVTLGLAQVQQGLRLLVHIKPLNGEFAKNPAALERILQPVKSVRLQSVDNSASLNTAKQWEIFRDGYQLWAEISRNEMEKFAGNSEFVLILDGVRLGIDRETTFGTAGLRNYLAATRGNTQRN